jgi:hypothetical protein
VELQGRAIFRVLNTTTLKEEVYRNVNFNKYKFPRLLDSTNNLLNTKKNPLTKKLVDNPSKNLTKSLDILHRESKDSLLRLLDTLKQANKLRAFDNSSQRLSSGS